MQLQKTQSLMRSHVCLKGDVYGCMEFENGTDDFRILRVSLGILGYFGILFGSFWDMKNHELWHFA